MARKKKNDEPTLDDLVELAKKVGLPSGALDDELHDACQSDMDMAYEAITEDSELREQLEFLTFHGWHKKRLAEIIEELAKEKNDEEVQ